MQINEMLDEVHRIATLLHGVGVGVQYREECQGKHTITLYRSRFKDGNINLDKEEGKSYEDVVARLYEKLVRKEKTQDILGTLPVIISTFGVHTHDDPDPHLSNEEVPGERYCYSVDEERWEGDEPTELAAFIAGCLAHDVKTLWVAQRVEIDIPEMLKEACLSSMEFIEQLQQQAVERAGEAGEGWLSDLTANGAIAQDLERELVVTVVSWLKRNNRMPNFFGISDARVRATTETEVSHE